MICNSCEQPFDANNWCPRCEHYEHEQLPETTLDQFRKEHPEIVEEVRMRFVEVEDLGPGRIAA